MSGRTLGGQTLVIRGRKVVGGVAEGEAMVTPDQISGWGGIDPRTGTVVETRLRCAARALRARCWCSRGPRGRRAGPRCSTSRGS